MKKLFNWVVLTLLLAVVIHLAVIYFAPTAIEALVIRKSLDASGLSYNQPLHRGLPKAGEPSVVRPSPDLLYTFIAYDLSEKPLRLRAPVPGDTYWSLSFYAANTDNFFHINDREAKDGRVEVVLAGPGQGSFESGGAQVVVSPSTKGVILVRILVKDQAEVEKLAAVQKQLVCEQVR
jgi:uncharacterized membrane protein